MNLPDLKKYALECKARAEKLSFPGCTHTETWAVETHNRLDCIENHSNGDCDASWYGEDIMPVVRQDFPKLADAVLELIEENERLKNERNHYHWQVLELEK